MGWALINFFCLWDGRLFEVGANSRLGAYSNKYGILNVTQQCRCSLMLIFRAWATCGSPCTDGPKHLAVLMGDRIN